MIDLPSDLLAFRGIHRCSLKAAKVAPANGVFSKSGSATDGIARILGSIGAFGLGGTVPHQFLTM